MKCFIKSIIPAMAILASSTALALDVDLSPRVTDGTIVADGHDDGSGTTTENVRVFAWEFGEIPADPFVIGDPGFNAFPGSGLPSGSQFGVRVLEDLEYWDGTGPVAFGAVPASETLKFQFGTQSRTVGTGTGELADFFFGPLVSGDGGFHEHLNSLLQGSDGNAVPASIDGIEATAGAYLVQLSLVSSGGSVLPSDTLFAVFNNGLSEPAFESSIDHVSSVLVPEPTTIALIAPIASLLLCKRSRNGCID